MKKSSNWSYYCFVIGVFIQLIVINLSLLKADSMRRALEDQVDILQKEVISFQQEVIDLQNVVESILEQPPVNINGEVMIKFQEVEDTIEFQLTEDDYKVMRILTAECGTNRDLCYGVAQALYNTCVKENCTPLEGTKLYKYTSPASWYSDEAYEAFMDVFNNGDMYEAVEDTLYFYAPKYCNSEWHESKHFIIEIDGVRFFGD